MRIDLDNLPVDPTLLQHLVRDMAALVESRDGEIEGLQFIIKNLQCAVRSRSERLDPDQLALALEDFDSDVARARERSPTITGGTEEPSQETPSRRKVLSDHRPRDDSRLDIEEPPAAIYLYAPDRRAERPASHLGSFKGVLRVDGYAGFER